eukprot:7022854-Pyramimonas_sp.AAC.1
MRVLSILRIGATIGEDDLWTCDARRPKHRITQIDGNAYSALVKGEPYLFQCTEREVVPSPFRSSSCLVCAAVLNSHRCCPSPEEVCDGWVPADAVAFHFFQATRASQRMQLGDMESCAIQVAEGTKTRKCRNFIMARKCGPGTIGVARGEVRRSSGQAPR